MVEKHNIGHISTYMQSVGGHNQSFEAQSLNIS